MITPSVTPGMPLRGFQDYPSRFLLNISFGVSSGVSFRISAGAFADTSVGGLPAIFSEIFPGLFS